jgi:hypothetical protein
MSYSNFINKLSSETKKALEESSNVNNEIQDLKKYKYSMKNLNDNTIGYNIKYKIYDENEIYTIMNPNSYEILLFYLIENEIFLNNVYIKYDISRGKKNEFYISFFHTNQEYLQHVHYQIIQNIKQTIQEMSKNMRKTFPDTIILPYLLKLKLLKKEYPILIKIICNIIDKNKLNDYSEEIVKSIIKILQINEIKIIECCSLHLTTYLYNDEPINYLLLNNKEEEKSVNSVNLENSEDTNDTKESNENKNIEFINNNIRQLFWHTESENKDKKSKNKFTHSLFFTFLFALIVYLLPTYINKLSDLNKNNIIIDNILDLATEDLTQTNLQKQTNNIKKMDTIIEQPNEPNEPNEPSEPSDQPDELKIIANNILKTYNDSSNHHKNIELKNIKDRLKLILEETSTN